MKYQPSWNRLVLSALCALTLCCTGFSTALATELPPGVLNYLRQQDPKVKVRFDGLVMFANGESYVPVIPQDPTLNPDSQQVIATLPEKAAYPDLIQFDNNFFLMRLIQTSTGRLTFPKMDEYPIQLKEGMLPQDFVLPANLYIPVELKIILGSLPYNPSYVPSKEPAIVPAAVLLSQGKNAPELTVTSRHTYVFDLKGQKLLAIDPLTGTKDAEVGLNGIPADLKMSPDGKLLFVASLSTNELVVIDTGSNLVKTRVSVGERPHYIALVPQRDQVVVSNRYSSYLSIINSKDLLDDQKLELPGNGGVMALFPGDGEPKLFVADATQPKVYLVDLASRLIQRTYDAVPDISAIRAFSYGENGVELWVASRTTNELCVLDGNDGRLLKTFKVGKKPVEIVPYENKLFVLSAGDAQIDRVDRGTRELQEPILLESGSFPSGIAAVPSEQRAYIATAGSTSLVVLNLPLEQIERTVPVDFRANLITITPDKKEAFKLGAGYQGDDSRTGRNASRKDGKKAEESHGQFANHPASAPKFSGKFSIIKLGREPEKSEKNTSQNAAGNDDGLPDKAGVRKERQPLALPLDATDSGATGVSGTTETKAGSLESLPDQQ